MQLVSPRDAPKLGAPVLATRMNPSERARASPAPVETRVVSVPASCSSSVLARGVDRRLASVSFLVADGENSTDVVVEQNVRDGTGASASSARDPTARWVWDTSPRLCEWLCQGENAGRLVRGKRVVELGAGAGLPGLVCARLGAASVTLTDLPQELDLLERNVRANARPGDAQVSVRACSWGDLDAWRGEEFDLVIVSDGLYHQPEPVLRALAQTIEALVSKNGGVVLFGYYFRENLIADAVFFDFIQASFDEPARISFEEDPSVWVFEWTPKSTN